jgi:cobalt-zinc-cadmium efflux system membrane fusion protein
MTVASEKTVEKKKGAMSITEETVETKKKGALSVTDEPMEKKKMSKSTLVVIAVVVLGVVGILVSRGRASSVGDAKSQAAAPATPAGPKPLALSPAARAKNPVKVAAAEMTKLAGDIQVVGTVAFHEDHFAVVGPLVNGRISRLVGGVGDKVRRGQVIAEIESSEVGQARAEYVSAKARSSAADANLRRETDLAEKKISSVREREMANAQSVTEQAGVRAAVMRLRAIGLTPADIEAAETHDLGGRVQIRAPISGTIIERKVTLGQAVERATDAFKIADTSHVWVSLDLYEKDLARVHVGQEVEMRTDSRPGEVFRGHVAFIVPVIDEATRTAKVRLEFPNPKGVLHAGQLVTARIVADPKQAVNEVLAVPRSAIEQVEGKTVVFVQTGETFERRNVMLGTSGGDRVEVRKGLTAGEIVAVDGAFLLKSELLR